MSENMTTDSSSIIDHHSSIGSALMLRSNEGAPTAGNDEVEDGDVILFRFNV